MPAISQVGSQEEFPRATYSRSRDRVHDLHTSPTAKMDFLRGLMAQAGRPCEGMNWRLLLLEWRYDLKVLLGNVRDWIDYIDRQFDRH